MAHIHRFYITPSTPTGEQISLAAEESHHALHVVRVKTGDEVALFDGRGRELTGVVAETTRREVMVAVRGERCEPLAAKQLTLAQAWLHNDKATEYLVRRATELGVAGITFFRGDRSQRPPRLNDKLERVAIEAAKQCGRLWLPRLEAVGGLGDVLTSSAEACVLIATMNAPPEPLRSLVPARDHVVLLTGPEGDFSEEELQTARDRGAHTVSLGDGVYRAEVAASLAAALIQYEWGAVGPLE